MADLSKILTDEESLELLKLESEHARVYGSKLDAAYVIAQRQAEIKRIQISIGVSEKRLLELTALISKIKTGV